MAGRDIVVVGTSSGGVEALTELVRGLPPGLPAAIFVVCHFPSSGRSRLPEILSREGALLADHARDGEPIYPGHIYIAPPDQHLLLEQGVIRLSHDPRENRFRPAIDPLFRSAARVYGERVIAILLSGVLSDGVAGLLAVRAKGGAAVLQDPQDALQATLPQNASDVVGADFIVPIREMAALLTQLIHQPIELMKAHNPGFAPPNAAETAVARDMQAQSLNGRAGELSVFSCPECGGVMWQLDEKGLLRFRCHVGHIFEGEMLLREQEQVLEAALWTAVRIFREKSILARQMAFRGRSSGHVESAERFEEESVQAQDYGDLIQKSILTVMKPAPTRTGGAGTSSPSDEPAGAPRPAAGGESDEKHSP